LVLLNKVQRIAFGSLNDQAIGHDFCARFFTKTVCLQQGARGKTDETVAAKAFTPNH
jgi:hypothetical protein